MSTPVPPLIRSDANLSAVSTSKPFVTKGTVTQLTSGTTAVTLNAAAGVITTFSLTTAATLKNTFTVNNSHVAANSVVVATIVDYSGVVATNGLPSVSVDSIASGSFDVTIQNNDAADAFDGVFKVAFIVV